jgi:hypothetical protein
MGADQTEGVFAVLYFSGFRFLLPHGPNLSKITR